MHIHWFRNVRKTETFYYYLCRCGERKARRNMRYQGYSPASVWVQTGSWTNPRYPPAKPKDSKTSCVPPAVKNK